MYIGITQSKTTSLLEHALATAGLSDIDSLVLFGGQFYRYEHLVLHQHLPQPSQPDLMEEVEMLHLESTILF